jgi:hypothetical protein
MGRKNGPTPRQTSGQNEHSPSTPHHPFLVIVARHSDNAASVVNADDAQHGLDDVSRPRLRDAMPIRPRRALASPTGFLQRELVAYQKQKADGVCHAGRRERTADGTVGSPAACSKDCNMLTFHCSGSGIASTPEPSIQRAI